MHMKRKSWTYPLNDLKNIEFVYFVNLVSPLEEDGLLRTPGWVVPTEAASSGDVLVCWWRLGEGSPQKREQALEGLTVPFWRPTASTADLQFFPHGCLSGQHQHASWFEGPIKVRGAIVSWGSQSYCFESWNSESCVIDSLSQQDLSCPLIQPFLWAWRRLHSHCLKWSPAPTSPPLTRAGVGVSFLRLPGPRLCKLQT